MLTIQSYKKYRFFKVCEDIKLYNIINSLIENSSRRDYLIFKLEEELGILHTCMNIEIYKVDNYYIALHLREDIINNKILYKNLKGITYEEFLTSIANGYIHYDFIGTGELYAFLNNKN